MLYLYCRSVLKYDIPLALVRGAMVGLHLQQFQGTRKREENQQMHLRGPNSSVFKENEKPVKSHSIFCSAIVCEATGILLYLQKLYQLLRRKCEFIMFK